MADPTIDDLLTPDTEDTELSFLLTQLADPTVGFPTANWQSGGVIYTLLRVFSRLFATQSTILVDIVKGGILRLSAGPWLDLLANWYDSLAAPVSRFPATFAQGTVALDVAAGSGPYDIAPSEVIVQDALKKQRYFSNNTGTVTLPAGPSTTIVPFIAEHPGAGYNVASTVGLTVTTPRPGLTARFSVPAGSNTWLTSQGTDAEKDADLRVRMRAKWGTVGFMKPHDAYLFLALNTPGVGTPPTKTVVNDNNPRGPNTLDVWLAGPLGPIPTADETLISNYIISLKSPTADVQVANADVLTVDIAYTLRFSSALSNVPTLSEEQVRLLVQAALIGGVISVDDMVAAAKVPSLPLGSAHVPLTSMLLNGANADLAIPANKVAVVGTVTITSVLV